jgi:hypothetical protein
MAYQWAGIGENESGAWRESGVKAWRLAWRGGNGLAGVMKADGVAEMTGENGGVASKLLMNENGGYGVYQ